MERLLMWLRMLGTAGAMANARVLHDRKEQDQWIVDALQARLMSVSDSQMTAA